MNKRVLQISLLALLAVSCSHSATPGPGGGGGNNPPGGSTGASCSASVPCSDSNEICDYLVPSAPQGTDATCRQKCDPSVGCGVTGEVCNPISGACEQGGCANQSNANHACALQLPQAGAASPVCITTSGSSYCAFQSGGTSGTSGTSCPSGLMASGGLCKFDASKGCSYSLTPDPVTGTSELSCTQGSQQCSVFNYTNTTSGSTPTPIAFSCSPVTSTCVQKCTLSGSWTPGQPLGSGGCTGGTRGACYVPGNPATGTGTCEKDCSKSPSACTTGLQCAESICQQHCTQNGDCTTKNNTATGKTICDLISNVCRVGCKSLSASCPSGLACSELSATCVPQSSTTYICADSKRNMGFTPYSGTAVCELPVPCSSPFFVADSTNTVCGLACTGNDQCPTDNCSTTHFSYCVLK